MKLQGRHWILRAVELWDKTDIHDTFVRERTFHLFHGTIPKTPGRIFFLEDPESGDAKVLIAEAPDYVSPSLTVKKENQVVVDAGGYPVTVLECRRGECEEVCRRWYREKSGRKTLITMSNTWGDMNSRDRVRQDFVRREIDTASELGLDVVQVDDGWQTLFPTGAIRDEKNRRFFFDPMWELSEVRFPEGMRSLNEYGKARNVALGLWFAPDSSNGFERKERDLRVLRKAYEEWGFRYFKLDMLSIQDRESFDEFTDMLNTIRSFGEDAEVQLDVTNEVRLGFLTGVEHGTVFVENRYVKKPDYFPHRALRNLWYLSRYLPACRFQMELVNPDLAAEAYGGDPFAPVYCDMDYLFATTMVSNPLFWMETQFLTQERRDQLMRVLPVWKEHRQILAGADVTPIGEAPCGRAVTGFCARAGEETYLVLIRESTDRERFTYQLPAEIGEPAVLASNGEASLSVNGPFLTVEFSKERQYLFLKA